MFTNRRAGMALVSSRQQTTREVRLPPTRATIFDLDGNRIEYILSYLKTIGYGIILEMENRSALHKGHGTRNLSYDLKSRLFEKGIGYSSVVSFQAPPGHNHSNKMLLVNLNSSKYKLLSFLVILDIHPKLFVSRLPGCPELSTKQGWGSTFYRRKIM